MESAVVILEGVLSSENVSEVEMQIMDQLNEVEHLIINVDRLTYVESSGFFMFYLVKKKAKFLGRTITIEGSEDSPFKKRLRTFFLSPLINKK